MLRRFRLPLSEFPERVAGLLEGGEAPAAVLRLARHGVCNQKTVELVAYFNLTGQPQPLPGTERPAAGLCMSSESSCYGGTRTAEDPAGTLLPFEFQVFGPDTTSTI
jgi:hypothetical protein